MDYTDEQREALTRARHGADLEMAGRSARDRAIVAALEAGLTNRAVAAGIGYNVDGSYIVTPSSVHRVHMAHRNEEATQPTGESQ